MAFEIENNVLKKYIPDEGIDEVTIPDNITEIADCAFAYCESLVKVTIPENVKTIGHWAFGHSPNLKEVILSEGVKTIGIFAFSECTGIEKITLPQSVQQIGRNIFGGCTSLKEAVIPLNNVMMGEFAVLGCDSLKVIKTCPDDPAIIRNYSKLTDGCLRTSWDMMQTLDYTLRIDRAFKFPFLLIRYLHTHDEEIQEYIKKNFSKLMKESITAGDISMISAFTLTDTFFTKRNINKFIQQAKDENQPQIEEILNNYQKQHLC